MVKIKRIYNDRQNITHKTKDRVTRTPLKTGAKKGFQHNMLVVQHIIYTPSLYYLFSIKCYSFLTI